MRLGEYLVQHKKVSFEAVEAAAREAQVTGDRIGSVLVRNGFLRQKDLIDAILELAPDRIRAEKSYKSRVPKDVLLENKVVVVAETESEAYISTLVAQDRVLLSLKKYYPDREIKFVPLAARDLDDFQQAIIATDEQASTEAGEDGDHAQVLEGILLRAIQAGASDIHIEPRGYTFTVFYRLLGVRQIVHEGPLDQYGVIAAQIKDKARMDQVETRIPQDGSFSISAMGRVVDARVATVPSVNGEMVIIRLLDPDKANVRIGELGISRINEWEIATGYPYGLALVCGATGSGKTTTLNATIREMDRFGKAIRTIEEPVEYRIPYVGQVNVNRIVGLDFAMALRAFMRADPDIIVMGEVRDNETATLTLKAAETGHFVMATLHTGSISGAFNRLKAIGVSPLDVQPLLRGVLVQRLIRTLCKNCKGAGCTVCFRSGYAGRTVVSECAAFRTEAQVKRAMEGERWWPTMVSDAIDKVKHGVTSVEECKRVFHSELENPEYDDDESMIELRQMLREKEEEDDY